MPSEASHLKQGKAASTVDALLARGHGFVEAWLGRVMPPSDGPPRRLHAAMHDAVFSRGRRLRPMLCRLVAELHGHGEDELVGRFAAAVELVHCASLVQVDLPCFDDAATRRGAPACHVAYGKATAILVGDALLTLAFEALANAPVADAAIAFRLMGLLASATGGARGLIPAQGLELETDDAQPARRRQTAALFRAAAAGAAIICGADADVPRWTRVGELIAAATIDRVALGELLGAPTVESEALQRLLAA